MNILIARQNSVKYVTQSFVWKVGPIFFLVRLHEIWTSLCTSVEGLGHKGVTFWDEVFCFTVTSIIPKIMENALLRRLGIASPMMSVAAKWLSCCFLLAACDDVL